MKKRIKRMLLLLAKWPTPPELIPVSVALVALIS